MSVETCLSDKQRQLASHEISKISEQHEKRWSGHTTQREPTF